jgi:hypothetical protein
MKPLDMADTYPPAGEDCYTGEDEVTVKIQVPVFHPQLVIPTEHPSYALVLCLAFGVASIFLPAYYIAIYWLFKP